ncbi:MAG: ABC transporter substrate-binding protein, partial [Acetobacteraceae bacterium]|nr:ABC transporter substrate-binding protein [Acetobacteraceae bacterium]
GLGAALFAAPAPAQQPRNAELRLGALFPFTGPLAIYGDEVFRGLSLAVAAANEAGGIAGRPVVLLRADAADAASAVAETRRLAAEGVPLLFGTFATGAALAASQAADQQGMSFVELAAAADALTARGFRHVFRTGPEAAGLAGLAAAFTVGPVASALGREPARLRIALLTERGARGLALATALAAAFAGTGVPAPENLIAVPGEDLAPLIGRLRAAETEVLFHDSDQAGILALARALAQEGLRPPVRIGLGAGYSLSDSAAVAGAAIEGAFSLDVPQYGAAESAAPGARRFAAAYRTAFGQEPRCGQSLAAFAGAEMALAALAAARGPEREALRAAFLALDRPVGSAPNGWGAAFSESGQNRRAFGHLHQWQDGRLVTVWPADAATAPPRLP